jgi:hypothetical protein
MAAGENGHFWMALPRRTILAVVVTAVLGLSFVAACGSGDDDDTAGKAGGSATTSTRDGSTTTAPAGGSTTTAAGGAPAGGGPGGPDNTGAPGPPTPGVPINDGSTPTTIPPDPTPTGDQLLVTLTTFGGITGRGDGGLEVTADGDVRHTGPDGQVEEDTLSAGDLRSLKDLLASADFAGVPAPPQGGGPCADAFVYTITYIGHTATADDCTTPEQIGPVLDRLQDIMSRFD